MLLEEIMQTTMYTAGTAFQTIATDSSIDVREQRTEPTSHLGQYISYYNAKVTGREPRCWHRLGRPAHATKRATGC